LFFFFFFFFLFKILSPFYFNRAHDLPSSVTISQFKRHAKISVSTDSYPIIQKAGKLFLDNLTRDLEAFAEHAHRKTIEQEDVELELKRQRFLTPKSSLADLMRTNLPWELVEQVIPVARANNIVSIRLQSRSKPSYTTNLGKRKRDSTSEKRKSRRPDWSENADADIMDISTNRTTENYGRPNKKKKHSITQIEGIVDDEMDENDNDFQANQSETEQEEEEEEEEENESQREFNEMEEILKNGINDHNNNGRVRFKSVPIQEEEEEEEEEEILQKPKRKPNIDALSKELNSED